MANGMDNLQVLHGLYEKYTRDLSRDTGREVHLHNYADFVGWWRELSPAVRARFERNYRKGYQKVILEERRLIAKVAFGVE